MKDEKKKHAGGRRPGVKMDSGTKARKQRILRWLPTAQCRAKLVFACKRARVPLGWAITQKREDPEFAKAIKEIQDEFALALKERAETVLEELALAGEAVSRVAYDPKLKQTRVVHTDRRRSVPAIFGLLNKHDPDWRESSKKVSVTQNVSQQVASVLNVRRVEISDSQTQLVNQLLQSFDEPAEREVKALPVVQQLAEVLNDAVISSSEHVESGDGEPEVSQPLATPSEGLVHREPNVVAPQLVKRIEPELPNKCNWCEERFFSLEELKSHCAGMHNLIDLEIVREYR